MKNQYQALGYSRIFVSFFIVYWLGFFDHDLMAQQCPTAAACQPATPSAPFLSFGMGISNVKLNTLDYTSPVNSATGTIVGYQDFSCTQGTRLTVAVNYPITITTNARSEENVRVYIDLNNDGILDELQEEVFASNNAFVHSGVLRLANTAVLNQPLRMRVISDFIGAISPIGPCKALEYGQAEDYYVILESNQSPANPDFTVSTNITCTGSVTFTDASQNGPTFWEWNFGDSASANNVTNLQNPSHTYTKPGLYTVSLKACNSAGCNITTKVNAIKYHNQVPVAAQCSPLSLNPCCGYGVLNVNFGGINNTSSDGSAGYQDFTCTQTARTKVGIRYPISITTGKDNPQDTYVWIDYNNDGIFDENTERAFVSLNSLSPSGFITIPANAVLDKPLRLRVSSDYANAAITLKACDNLTRGQAEDYTIIISPNVGAPVPDFSVSVPSACDSVFTFSNLTQVNPSATTTTYKWVVTGQANSTDTNPVYKFPAVTGAYTVRLVACNIYGCDSVTKNDVVQLRFPCVTYCASTGHINTQQWISNVTLGTINNTTAAGTNGYSNFTNFIANLVVGTATNPITVRAGSTRQNYNIAVWIDFNKNGTFEATERVLASNLTQLPNRTGMGVTGNIVVPNTARTDSVRMRVVMVPTTMQNTNPCLMNINGVDVEDYTIRVLPNVQPPKADFSADFSSFCPNGTVNFTDKSSFTPTSWQWRFGTGATSAVANPSYVYSVANAASYSVSLKVCNVYGCDSVTKVNLVNVSVPCKAPIVYCPSSGHRAAQAWITNVTVGTINNNSPIGTSGYSDFTSIKTDLMEGSKNNSFVVKMGSNRLQTNVAIWIDFNQDGVFGATEKVFGGNVMQLPNRGGIGVSSYFDLPANVILGEVRMRVMAVGGNNLNISNDDPCAMNLPIGDVEDYTINIVPNTQVPVAAFSANFTSICNGQVSFKQEASNGPISWLWNFGDGNTSSEPNPVYNYSTQASATYSVSLKVCNNNGCDSLTKNSLVPITVPCSVPQYYCTSSGHNNSRQWISEVAIADIANTSAAGLNGYTDFTGQTANLYIGGTSIPLRVALGSNAQQATMSVWIDLNRNGSFETDEKVFGGNTILLTLGKLGIAGSITIPPTTEAGLTRMRIVMGQPNVANENPCVMNLRMGDVEDYTINLRVNQEPPVVAFAADFSDLCNGGVDFQNQTIRADAYVWDFGDGTTSTELSPSHTYNTAENKNYDITLIGCNAYGCDTLTKSAYVRVSNPCQIVTGYCQAIGNVNAQQWISSVSVGQATQKSDAGANGYTNFTATTFDLYADSSRNHFAVMFGTNRQRNVTIWIDYNKNGVFDANEVAFTGLSTFVPSQLGIGVTGTINIPVSAAPTLTRMRIVSTAQGQTNNNPCVSYLQSGDVEDYTVAVGLPTHTAPKQAPQNTITIYPNPNKGSFVVGISAGQLNAVAVYDVLGRLVYAPTTDLDTIGKAGFAINLGQVPKGLYWVKLKVGSQTVVKKIVVEN